MVNTPLIALLGFLLLHLAEYIEPSNGFLRARLATARQGEILVVFAFLLLVPLQGFATWRVLTQAHGSEAMQRNVLGERVTMIRRAIEAATSSEDLQARFSRFQGPRPQLPPAAVALPLPELKCNLLSELRRKEARASARIRGPAPAPAPGQTAGGTAGPTTEIQPAVVTEPKQARPSASSALPGSKC